MSGKPRFFILLFFLLILSLAMGCVKKSALRDIPDAASLASPAAKVSAVVSASLAPAYRWGAVAIIISGIAMAAVGLRGAFLGVGGFAAIAAALLVSEFPQWILGCYVLGVLLVGTGAVLYLKRLWGARDVLGEVIVPLLDEKDTSPRSPGRAIKEAIESLGPAVAEKVRKVIKPFKNKGEQ